MVGVDVPVRAAGFLMKKELEYFSKVSDEDKQELMLIKNLIKEKLETEEKYFKIKKLDFGYNNNNKNTNSTFIVNKISGNYNLSLFI